MKFRSICGMIFFVFGFLVAVEAKPPDWFQKLRSVKILESKRSDVERVFSDSTIDKSYRNGKVETVIYRTAFGEIEAVYSGGDCEKYYDYRVPQGTLIVLRYFLPFEPRFKFKKLGVDADSYIEVLEDDASISRLEPSTGFKFITNGKVLRTIVITPPEAMSHLKCEK